MPRPNRGPHVRFRKDRNCWGVAEFAQGNLKWHATGCGSQQDAQGELARILIRNDSHTGPSSPEQRLIKDVLSSYLLEHGPQTQRPDNLIHACKTLAPFWGNLPVSGITKATCQRYAAERRSGFKKRRDAANKERIKAGKDPLPARELSNASARLELATLKAALNHDHQEGRLLHVPSVWLPPKPASRERWLTKREAAKLLSAARELPTAKEYLPLFILLALYTGARKQAVLSLRWPQVDFKREIIDFRAGGPQSSKARAVVPIPRRLLRELIKAKKQGTDLGYVVHVKETIEEDGVKKVVHERLGDIKKGFQEACRIAALENVIPHTLRHTAASWMVQKGVPLFDVARYLGHTSTMMVEKTYGHMAPEHLRRAKDSWG